MPRQQQSSALVLKHRLTGAAVLIAFAVIVLPQFLSSPGGERQGADTQNVALAETSNTGAGVFRSNITPISGATPNAQGAVPADAPAPPGDLTHTVGDLLEQQASEEPPPPPPVAHTETATRAPSDERPEVDSVEIQERSDTTQIASAAVGEIDQPVEATKQVEHGWIVQVGTFQNADNVRKLVAKLDEDGFGSSTTDIEMAGGQPATRVWVGPFETHAQASEVKTQVKQSLGSDGLIVAYP